MSEKLNRSFSQQDIADHDRIVGSINEALSVASRGLTEIRDRKLYLLYADSFEEWGQKVLKRSRAWLYQQLEVERVQDSMPPEVCNMLDSVRKVREIEKVPPKRRMGVLAAIQKNGHAVTPKTIRETARELAPPPAPKKQDPIDVEPIVRDATGYEIPKHRVEYYEKCIPIAREILGRVSSLRGALNRAQGSRDPQFAFVSISTTMSLLNNVYGELSAIMPHAVCPYCQGQLADHCTVCRKTGFLPKHQWDHAVPSDLKAVREKAAKKKG